MEMVLMDKAWVAENVAILEAMSKDHAWLSWQVDAYLLDLPGKWGFSFFVVDDGKICGYAICSLKGRVLWVNKLVVGFQSRRNGIGKWIISQLIDLSRDRGLVAIGLKTPAQNGQNVSFYEACGFKVVDPKNSGYITLIKSLGDFSVGVHQPNYIPWLGYYYKIYRSDVFVYLDSVQMATKGYVNRNTIDSRGGGCMLTLPVQRGRDSLISEAVLTNHVVIKKHLSTMYQTYCKAPNFKRYFERFHQVVLDNCNGSLVDLNFAINSFVLAELGLFRPIVKFSNMASDGVADERLANIVSDVGGSRYLSGGGGDNYQEASTYSSKGVALEYVNFKPVPYKQLYAVQFNPYLSVVDALFNVGAEGIMRIFSEQDR